MEKIRLAVSPLSWTNDVLADLGGNTPVETCLTEAARAGYEGVELGRLFPRDPARLRPMMDAHGLALASGWHSGRLAEDDVATERAAVRQHAALLRDMGCKVLVYGETAMMAGDAPLDAPMSQRRIMAAGDIPAYGHRLSEFSDWLAGEYGLRLAYHHHLMMVAETFQETAAIIEAAPHAGLLLDTGHAAAGGFDYADLIDRFGNRIAHIHLKDMRADIMAAVRSDDAGFNDGVRRGMFTVPGDGCVDFAPLARYVQDHYTGWLVVEAEQDPKKAPPLPAVSRARDHVAQIFNLNHGVQ